MENYIVINGKRLELTEEQLEKLGIKPENKNYKEMFELLDDKEPYFFINDAGGLVYYSDVWRGITDARYTCGNACKDKDIMKQRALHETLNRLLWRASVIAGELDNEWNRSNAHYYIYRDLDSGCLRVCYNDTWKDQGACYFPTEDSAHDALGNIVIPFLNEHPDFKW